MFGLFFEGNRKSRGRYERKACPECDGSGRVECDCTGGLGEEFADDDCPACGGTGQHTCPVCNGYGYIRIRIDE